MKYIKTMLFVLLASIATSPLFAADIAGGYIGIQASVNGVEIDGDIADDINRSVIQDQVEMGVAVRMAAMDLLARNRQASAAEGMS